MQLLLRKLSADSDLQEYVDSEIAGEEVRLGSSPQSGIQLLDSGIAPTHARLTVEDGRVRLRAARGKTFSHRGEKAKDIWWEEGEEVQIGSQVFCRTAAPPGFDLSLEWRAVEMPGHLLANAYRTTLDDLGFGPRRLAWILALAVLLLAGLAPLAESLLTRGDGEQALGEGSQPLSSFWLSGPLHSAHKVALGDDCSACHGTPFKAVPDDRCQACHGEVRDHLAANHPSIEDWGEHADFDQFACKDCHREHNEPQSLVSEGDSLCRTCHAEIEPRIQGFGDDRHPEFALTLSRPDVRNRNGTIEVDWQREKVARDQQPQETSHLKYPHDLHLDAEAVSHPQRGDALQCADCHRLSSDREHFEPITMEQDCAACHELSFDPGDPQKQLPHGSPDAVLEALEAHFVQQAFGEQQDQGVTRRRRPGRERAGESCEGDYQCARQQALREAERQFSQRGCVTCHRVDQLEGARGADRWQVLPVKLNPDWYSDARFDHQSHLTQAEQDGDELCLTCHAADQSDTSADILMPELQQCSSCHGDRSVGGRVTVNCIACHGYHKKEGAPMLQTPTLQTQLDVSGAPADLLGSLQ